MAIMFIFISNIVTNFINAAIYVGVFGSHTILCDSRTDLDEMQIYVMFFGITQGKN